MNKRVVGIYNRQEAVVLEIDKLKALGHDESSIFVLAKDHHRASEIVEETGVQVEEIPEEGTPEPKGAGVFSRMFYALDYDTQHSGVAAVLKSAGITEDEVGSYVRKLEQGDLVILANAEVPRQPYSDESDAGFSNEEQSMQYYESALNKGNTNSPPPLNQQGFSTHEKTRGLYDEDVQHSYAQNQNQYLQGNTDFSNDGAQNVTKEEIYVEHIYFDSLTPPLETNDEELIRVPITEERVKVINEKVVTGEIVVRRRTI
jgi:stress response protein YsnF